MIEVETELTGKGTPIKKMDVYTTVPDHYLAPGAQSIPVPQMR